VWRWFTRRRRPEPEPQPVDKAHAHVDEHGSCQDCAEPWPCDTRWRQWRQRWYFHPDLLREHVQAVETALLAHSREDAAAVVARCTGRLS